MRKQPSTEPFYSGSGRGNYRVLGVALALSGAVAVALGAYAAHGMAARADEAAIDAVNVGVRYQMWHTLALLALLIWQRREPAVKLRPVMALWVLGIAAFSGSLYAMALGGFNVGLVTPLGGLLLIAGWLTLGVVVLRAGHG
ncbi:DUF423 domain-containing protein [Halomonas piscis]|uniref:DUF423 domain-containing protein n=1 Tax=Halomonas piscis TaxID=3031727 RepID=A0ABY9Z2K0_9GAMM|nr:DUF423 domain-containing protein [Halomonas piscis]WNK20443.1 DUF423 domain-containing protein [Halomonas piscis]